MPHSYYIQPVRSSRHDCTKVWLPGKNLFLKESKSWIIFLILASSLTGLETWVIACLSFVFLAIVEYGLASRVSISSKEKIENLKKEADKKYRIAMEAESSADILNVQSADILNVQSTDRVHAQDKEELQNQIDKAERLPMKIDRWATFIFPCLFLIFNFFYWAHYIAHV